MSSRQLCDQWIVNTWDKIPAKLVKKSWDMREAEAAESSGRQIVNHSQKDIVAEFALLIDGDALQHCLADLNDHEDIDFNDEDAHAE